VASATGVPCGYSNKQASQGAAGWYTWLDTLPEKRYSASKRIE